MSLIPVYRRRATPLHAARASVGLALCGAFLLVAVLYSNPIVLAGALAGLAAAAAGAGASAQLARAARLALPLALLLVAINALVYREGATVIFRGGEVLGRRLDVTLESVAAGGAAALRVLVVAAAFALYSAALDPDEVLRLLRRFSYHSALTGSLATRLIPVLHRDAQRMIEAARCRPTPPRRSRVVLATLGRSLDRAIDVAAALEVRGYARARPAAPLRRPWSRHDVRIAAVTALVLGLAVGARIAGLGAFDAYPTVSMAAGPATLTLAAAMALAGALPSAGTRARLGVAS
ncbi:MAG: energy-coupling factor transport system permease protein [Thermoleophilaceae bacterium]|jgi:energy-coupling factor transport system permease protein|nr:energy-coupling factor transport system permease protein [Thermoleophilaceae bacterium]